MGEIAVLKKESFWDELQKMEDRVMRRAYDIFRIHGSEVGTELDDWLTAERELVWRPAIEMREKDGQLELQVAVAGIDPKDLRVEVTGEDLLIRGETKTEKREEKGTVYTTEFQIGSLFRSIHLPKKVDPNKVKAELKNGLLTIVAPIAEEAKARRVDIQAA